MSSHCAALPPEIRHLICQSLLKTDLKNLRLVNAPWGSVGTSILFHSFVSDLVETDKKKLDAILKSRPGGILDSIKTLTVPYKGHDAHEKQSQDLLRLASVLPKDVLTQLQACVERDDLSVILGRQSKIQKLNIFVVSNGQPSSPPNANSVRGNLNELQILNLVVRDNNADKFACWTPHMPSLRGLRLSARSAPASFGGWHLSPQDAKFKLRCLIFDEISLPNSPKKIMGMLDVSRLEVLSFDGCRNSGPLIRSMAEEFQRVPDKLRVFRHMLEAYKGPLNHIQSLLDSTTKMTEISINAMQAHPLPIACIARHGSSLQSLQLSFWHGASDISGEMYDAGYSTQSLNELITACTSLEFIGLSLANINFRTWDLLDDVQITSSPNATGVSRRLAEALTIIARAPKLETLCLTHVPYCQSGEGFTTRVQQFRHSQMATSILSFLDKLGSPIRFLAFHPPGLIGPVGRVDSHGHTWPNYYYRKARIVIEEDRAQGALGVLAIPVRFEAFKDLSRWHQRFTWHPFGSLDVGV